MDSNPSTFRPCSVPWEADLYGLCLESTIDLYWFWPVEGTNLKPKEGKMEYLFSFPSPDSSLISSGFWQQLHPSKATDHFQPPLVYMARSYQTLLIPFLLCATSGPSGNASELRLEFGDFMIVCWFTRSVQAYENCPLIMFNLTTWGRLFSPSGILTSYLSKGSYKEIV